MFNTLTDCFHLYLQVALKRWYRNMQTFVASFAYLRRTSEKWDQSKALQESRVTRELHQLMISARYILCEIETAINNTYPYDHGKKLTTISRETMNKKLKFRTKKQETNGQQIDDIDLKFVKYYYYDFLSTMWKVLRRHTRRRNQFFMNNRSSGRSRQRNNASQGRSISDINVSYYSDGSSAASASVSSYELEEILPNKIIYSHTARLPLSALLSSTSDMGKKLNGRARRKKNRKSQKTGAVNYLNEVIS